MLRTYSPNIRAIEEAALRWRSGLEGEGIACPWPLAHALAGLFFEAAFCVEEIALIVRLRCQALHFDQPDLEEIVTVICTYVTHYAHNFAVQEN